ncbi:glycosyltransferase [Chryseobacterium aahli]|uniref:glycosyltransferase n=1 Tax=Chryseobacterium aahli TaxID=1278643 RepID=UPI001F623F4F|nr:glycosyltransferase [Chryseobacterium aahli]MCI3936820.1 glycosyltransferase [Chryseobacterium aahli]
MKINFIGGFFPEDQLSDYINSTKGDFHYAADSLQKSIISGLKINSIETKLITIPFLTNYPNNSNIIVKGHKGSKYSSIPFINLKLIDSFSKSINLKKFIINEIPNKEDEILLIYGMFDYFLKGIPNTYKNKISLIVPDLPAMMGGDMKKFHIKMYIKYVEYMIKKNIHKVDSFVFISKYMKDMVDTKGKPWVVVEGIYNNQINVELPSKEESITILYTGTLAKRYGIIELINAFSLIENQDYKLWICGDGDGRENVENAAKKDARIKYFGIIPNNESLVLQRRATILVNPRQNNSEYTKYSFPSKTMEYLASGTPTIMYKLDGVPEEYCKYFFSPKDNSENSLKEKIIEIAVLKQEERDSFGKIAQNFIFENKNPQVQVEKIINMVKDLI